MQARRNVGLLRKKDSGNCIKSKRFVVRSKPSLGVCYFVAILGMTYTSCRASFHPGEEIYVILKLVPILRIAGSDNESTDIRMTRLFCLFE